METQIRNIILGHIGSVNSFVDENGHNHFNDCVKDLLKVLGHGRRAGFYTHMDGSVCCEKCHKTLDEGCKCKH